MHNNLHDHPKAVCKKQLAHGGGQKQRLSDMECKKLLKQWLLYGLHITEDDPSGRETHLSCDPRTFDKNVADEVLDARLHAELPAHLRA